MKKTIRLLLLFFILFFGSNVSAKEATLYFFYGEGCPHCAKEEIFLKTMEEKYEELKVERYETYNNSNNRALMNKKKDELGVTSAGVPFTIIGEEYLLGYTESYADRLENYIKEAIADDETNCKVDENILNIPLIGEVNVKNISIGLVTIVLGLVDGFNPCAMWVLLFLISTLIGMKDKKRKWILGITFLGVSALVYMLIMLSWVDILVNVGTTVIIRSIIAIIAIIGAILNIKSYLNSKVQGCQVIDDSKRKKIFDNIKKFTSEKSFFLSFLGVIGLAISVNLIELACSAGLPILFSSILAINNITGLIAFLYTVLYIIFFLLDDLIIFIIAMFTLKITGISTKYSKYSHLIGGILMFLIGLLLLIKPEWIMFNF